MSENSFVCLDKDALFPGNSFCAPFAILSENIPKDGSVGSSCGSFSLLNHNPWRPPSSDVTSLPIKLNNSMKVSSVVQKHGSAPELKERSPQIKVEGSLDEEERIEEAKEANERNEKVDSDAEDDDDDGEEEERYEGEEISNGNESEIPLSVDFGDIETALICLRQENDKLRYALEMNTEAMKRQLSIIKGSKEVSLQMKKDLEDLKRIKDMEIEALKRENQELRKAIERKTESHSSWVAPKEQLYPTLPCATETSQDYEYKREDWNQSFDTQSGITEFLEEAAKGTGKEEEINALRLQLEMCLNDLKVEQESKMAFVELSQKLEEELQAAYKALDGSRTDSGKDEESSDSRKKTRDERGESSGHERRTPMDRRHSRRHNRHKIKLVAFRPLL